MVYDAADEQYLELTHEFEQEVAVLFDSEKVLLEGRYEDELSVFRAKRVWTEVLEANFLLEKGDDFSFRTLSEAQDHHFVLTCSFKTACGRYAFWRLVNAQAPESQYLIETAHIPDGASQHFEFLRAPDLQPALGSANPRVARQSLGRRLMSWFAHCLFARRA